MWKILNSKEIYKNPWLKVKEDKVIIESGRERTFTTVDIKPGVSVLVVDEKMNAYLSKGYQYALDEEITGVTAGGGIDDGENPLECAKRELKEETGFIASEWIELGKVHAITSGIISSPNYLFLARDFEKTDRNLEDTEKITTYKLPLKDAFHMVISGEITHSASAVLIMKAWNYLNS
ncbi:NUDIX hydrolase [Candidatus Dojkabacteria bacterium]|jgi:8-oxo-dGTP pyrophosphatase MutT (NUDIX family)|uniref:NUDIX hydrolase n=1 Tax=Candidatus Dojkabacteria bacterium TaxID=2099670 RepID=A0A955L0S9_9BACT|nr:NUDIX hydrolase [Candidatus Dojkabacteria bacterium]